MYSYEWFLIPGPMILDYLATLLAIGNRTWISENVQLDLHMADLEEDIHT